MFGDDAVPPRILRALAAEARRDRRPFYWQAEVRWDALATNLTCALARAGARNLVFGLESGNADVLKRMRKGASLAHAQRILNGCKRAGIGVNLQCFLGFPGERITQALDTLQFVRRHTGAGVTVSCGEFVLLKGSPLWRDRAALAPLLPSGVSAQELAVQVACRPRYGRSRQRRFIKRIEALTRANPPQLGCGINAHALIYLASEDRRQGKEPAFCFDPCGTIRLTSHATWRCLAWDPSSFARGTPRRKETTVAFCLDSAVMLVLGPIAHYVIRACMRPISGQALLAGLETPERGLVLRKLRGLARKGLLENAPELPICPRVLAAPTP
jgi:hypothetical protein